MSSNKRFHAKLRRDKNLGSTYTDQKIVITVDDITEIELHAQDSNDLLDLLSDSIEFSGWKRVSTPTRGDIQKRLIMEGVIPKSISDVVIVDRVELEDLRKFKATFDISDTDYKAHIKDE